MACDETLGPAQARLFTDTAVDRYAWLFGWIAAAGITDIKCTLKNKDADAGFRSQIAVQTASVRPDSPDAAGTLGSALTGGGEACTGVVGMTATLEDKTWFRLGVMYDLASGTEAQADVEVTVTFLRCGKVLGSVTLTLVATSDSVVLRAPVTDWLPVHTSGKIDFAAVTSGLTGNFQWKLVCRMATTSKEDPGSWESIGDTDRSSDGEVCSTGLSPTTPGPKMWIQYAIEYTLSSSGDPAQATIDLLMAVMKP